MVAFSKSARSTSAVLAFASAQASPLSFILTSSFVCSVDACLTGLTEDEKVYGKWGDNVKYWLKHFDPQRRSNLRIPKRGWGSEEFLWGPEGTEDALKQKMSHGNLPYPSYNGLKFQQGKDGHCYVLALLMRLERARLKKMVFFNPENPDELIVQFKKGFLKERLNAMEQDNRLEDHLVLEDADGKKWPSDEILLSDKKSELIKGTWKHGRIDFTQNEGDWLIFEKEKVRKMIKNLNSKWVSTPLGSDGTYDQLFWVYPNTKAFLIVAILRATVVCYDRRESMAQVHMKVEWDELNSSILTQAQTEAHSQTDERLPGFSNERILGEMFDIPMACFLSPATWDVQQLVDDYGANEDNIRMTVGMSNHAFGLFKAKKVSDQDVSVVNPWYSEKQISMGSAKMIDQRDKIARVTDIYVFPTLEFENKVLSELEKTEYIPDLKHIDIIYAIAKKAGREYSKRIATALEKVEVIWTQIKAGHLERLYSIAEKRGTEQMKRNITKALIAAFDKKNDGESDNMKKIRDEDLMKKIRDFVDLDVDEERAYQMATLIESNGITDKELIRMVERKVENWETIRSEKKNRNFMQESEICHFDSMKKSSQSVNPHPQRRF